MTVISPVTYNTVLQMMAPLLAGLFWLAAALLARQGRQNGELKRRMGTVLWAGHVALYWSVNSYVRWFDGYQGPSTWASLWGIVIYVHAGVSLLLMAWVLRKPGKDGG